MQLKHAEEKIFFNDTLLKNFVSTTSFNIAITIILNTTQYERNLKIANPGKDNNLMTAATSAFSSPLGYSN